MSPASTTNLLTVEASLHISISSNSLQNRFEFEALCIEGYAGRAHTCYARYDDKAPSDLLCVRTVLETDSMTRCTDDYILTGECHLTAGLML